ncbi:MAG: hypothetical protein ACE5GO_12000, partial [Anaerolineales bacterium]
GTYCSLAKTCLRRNKTGDALSAAEKALALGQEREQSEFVGIAWRVLGMISDHTSRPVTIGERRYTTGRLKGGNTRKLLRGRYTGRLRKYSAKDCFSNSLRILTDLGMKKEQAHTLWEWARYESNRGEREIAEEIREKAQQIYERLGIEKEVRQVNRDGYKTLPIAR